MESTTTTNGYKFDFASRTLTITKKFADAAENPNSDEYKLIKQFQSDIPNLIIKHRTHKTPSAYHNSNGVKTKHNQFKGLSVERMEKFINALPNNEKFITPFNFLKAQASYSVLAQWFMAQFPGYRKNPLFYLTNDVEVINFSDYIQKEKDA